MTNHAKKGIVQAAAVAGTLLLLIISAFTFGPRIESELFPPLDNVDAVLLEAGDQTSTVFLKANKARSCLYVNSIAVVRVHGEDVTTGHITLMKAEGNVVRPEQQREAAGATFVRLLRVSPGSRNIILYPEYSCHPFWRVRQQIRVVNK